MSLGKGRCFLTKNSFNYTKKQLYSSLGQSVQQKQDDHKFAKVPDCVFSGIQPTGVPHLGNYIGAISNWVQLQRQYDNVLLSIVDLHSITVPQDPNILRENILTMAACLIACGIDPSTTILFQQSTVPYHNELAWILGCLCNIPRLSGMAQWKDKSSKVKDPSIGLYTYPILQSADILLYKSNLVPVGEDQIQHLEMARDLARTFNMRYGIVFPKTVPLSGNITKIRSLKDPTSKMSKSDPNELSRIDLNDSSALVEKKLKKCVTDSVSRHISYHPIGRPGVTNLIDIHSSLTGLTQEEVVSEYSEFNTVQYKAKVAEVVNSKIQPISDEMTKLLGDKQHLQSLLRLGTEKATEKAEGTMKEIRQLVGLR